MLLQVLPFPRPPWILMGWVLVAQSCPSILLLQKSNSHPAPLCFHILPGTLLLRCYFPAAICPPSFALCLLSHGHRWPPLPPARARKNSCRLSRVARAPALAQLCSLLSTLCLPIPLILLLPPPAFPHMSPGLFRPGPRSHATTVNPVISFHSGPYQL